MRRPRGCINQSIKEEEEEEEGEEGDEEDSGQDNLTQSCSIRFVQLQSVVHMRSESVFYFQKTRFQTIAGGRDGGDIYSEEGLATCYH